MILYYFLIAFVISLFGTIPIGLIAVTVVDHTISKGQRAGIMIALGASFFEFFYTYVALVGLDFMATHEQYDHYIQVATCIIFFALGLYFFFSKTPAKKETEVKNDDQRVFWKGFITGSMSIAIIPFWVFIGLFLKTCDIIMISAVDRIAFSIGSAFGAFAIFVGYAVVSKKIVERFAWASKMSNRVSAFVLFGLGFIQLIRLL